MKVVNLNQNKLYERSLGKKPKGNTFTYACVLFFAFLLIFSTFWFFTTFKAIIVDGSSMRTTLSHGDKLFARTVKVGEACRGDIIVVDVSGYPECSDVSSGRIIKRLIAKEGDKVKCRNGVVSVWYADANGWTVLEEDYAYYGKNDAYKDDYDFEEYQVGAGEIFFLGDNRSSAYSSEDSRYKEDKSHLEDKLYKESDIIAVVEDWSVRNKWIGEILIRDPKKD